MGITFILLPLIDCLIRWNIISNGVKTNASVLRTEKSSGGDSVSYYPVFLYTVDGKPFEVKYSTGNIRPKFQDGEIVQIIYHRQKPRKIWLPLDKIRIYFNVIFIVIGMVFMLVHYIVD